MSSSVEKMEVDSLATLVVKRETEEELHFNVLASQNLIIKDEDREHLNEPENQNAGITEDVKDGNEMEVDGKELLVCDEKTEDPVRVQIEATQQGIMQLSVEGVAGDGDEETIILSSEEVRTYLEDKIKEYFTDPKINPLLELTKRSQELAEDFKEKNEEFNKLNKLFDLIYRNQEKFLRHMGILPKIPTHSVAIAVDLPLLPHSVPHIARNTQESLIKKDLNNTLPAPAKKALPVPVALSVPVPGPKLAPKPAENVKKSVPQPPGSNIECIDLTDEMDTPSTSVANCASHPVKIMPVAPPNPVTVNKLKHPAPLPPRPYSAANKALPNLPPKPRLKVHAEERGIVLQWDMPYNISPNPGYGKLCAYDIFGYQEMPNAPINSLLWKKIGSVKAMTLPMACTLTQFLEGYRYHFSIRAMDIHERFGSYSDPISIIYTTRPKKT